MIAPQDMCAFALRLERLKIRGAHTRLKLLAVRGTGVVVYRMMHG